MNTSKQAKIHMLISRFAENPTDRGWYQLLERALELEFTDESIPREHRLLLSNAAGYFNSLRK